jgi:3-(3-hydroxy-phenyl)propionate hydroxylase
MAAEGRAGAASVPVIIAGGGPVGLVLGALLSRYGIASWVIEADDTYCHGSRALCISRRSQEILGWIGVDGPMNEKGLSWTGGRSYFRDAEVLNFQMPTEPTERFAPMVNIQQYYVEQYAHEALARNGGLCKVLWSTRVVASRPGRDDVEVEIERQDGARETLRGPWLVACDGARSSVREHLGLALQGTQYEGRYVIVDIEQATTRNVERLVWFDPPSNPGSTVLMHRQPDNIWRVDYQLRDGEDPVEAVKPENVLPRVQSHLDMIGETAPWKPLWISAYNAKCLTLPGYRHGRVLFAGDAAHLVPIFGVRGLNSGLDDVGNLAWKLSLVIGEMAGDGLLDSYSDERMHATRENIAHASRSTEFMAPPHFGFELMRQATLRLATVDPGVRCLINPRQSSQIDYPPTMLEAGLTEAEMRVTPRTGTTAPEARLQGHEGQTHLTQYLGGGFVVLCFTESQALPAPIEALLTKGVAGPASVAALCIARRGGSAVGRAIDVAGEAWGRYAAREGSICLVRPDGYVLATWHGADWARVESVLREVVRRPSAAGVAGLTGANA